MSSEIDEDDDEDLDAPLSDDAPLPDEDLDEFEGEDIELDDEDLELDPKERAARSLEIRRAIESRLEERKLREDLDYLDLEGDDLD
jgi:hypothetical protein